MKKLVGPLTLALAILIADRASKLWVLKHVTAWDIWPIIPGFMNIIHAENRAWHQVCCRRRRNPRAFVLIGLVTVASMWRSTGTAERWALRSYGRERSATCGPIARGTVTDSSTLLRRLQFATFNVADSAHRRRAAASLADAHSKEPEAARVPAHFDRRQLLPHLRCPL
jgi:hypothetical protein